VVDAHTADARRPPGPVRRPRRPDRDPV